MRIVIKIIMATMTQNSSNNDMTSRTKSLVVIGMTFIILGVTRSDGLGSMLLLASGFVFLIASIFNQRKNNTAETSSIRSDGDSVLE